MTSGQDVSEFLDTLGLVKSYFSSFLRIFFMSLISRDPNFRFEGNEQLQTVFKESHGMVLCQIL
jgi:hypothetical protein